MHNPEFVLENETHKLLWDFEIQTDQARMILKNGWFSDFEMLEICEKVNREEYDEDPPT